MSKYRNKKTVYKNIKFDSLKELNRYKELEILFKIGEITDLKTQPKYLLQEAFKHNVNGKLKTHRAINYIADFEYKKGYVTYVEDVKGMKTDVYKLKKKLFLMKYPTLRFYEM